MTVYIEYVLIDNFVIDYLLLKSTFSITSGQIKSSRLILSAFFGAVAALSFPIIERAAALSVVIKLLFGLIMVGFAKRHETFREYYLDCLVFLAVTFFAGGAVLGVFALFNVQVSSEISVATGVIPAYVILRLVRSFIKYLLSRKRVACLTIDVGLELGGREIKAKGFLDTGNALYDHLDPVIVCSKKVADNLIGLVNPKELKFKKIALSTVNGKSDGICFKLSRLLIYNGDKPNIFNNVSVLVSKKHIGDGYDVILHPAFMEDCYVEECRAEVKEVS